MDLIVFIFKTQTHLQAKIFKENRHEFLSKFEAKTFKENRRKFPSTFEAKAIRAITLMPYRTWIPFWIHI